MDLGEMVRVLRCKRKGNESSTFHLLKYISYLILFIILFEYNKISSLRYIYMQQTRIGV